MESGTFTLATKEEVVEVGLLSFPIKGYSTCIIKGLFPGNRNLELTKVAVIKGFYINIISEARLYNTNV